MVTNSTLESMKVKDIPIAVTLSDGSYKFEPIEDITGLEAMKITSMLFASFNGANIDIDYYIRENNLERHFIKE